MNLKELADLVVVRNHISFLLNTERALITKDLMRSVDSIRTKLDKLFLENIQKTDFTNEIPNKTLKSLPATIVTDPSLILTLTNGAIVANPNNEKQLDLDFDSIKEPVHAATPLPNKGLIKEIKSTQQLEDKAKADKAAIEAEDLKLINERLAKAKAEVAKKASSKQTKKITKSKREEDLLDELEE